MENKKITAVEARKTADTSEKFIARVYKFIKEEAGEGRTTLNYCIWNVSAALIEKLEKDLRNNGFTTEIAYEVGDDEITEIPTNMLISW